MPDVLRYALVPKVTLPAISPDLAAAQAAARHWLFDQALPLWAERGLDREQGGCFEALDADANPVHRAKRCRVPARQVYVFCTAGRLGWSGPWRTAAAHALDFMLRAHRLPDGSFRSCVARDGTPLDGAVDNYDQAFAVFALAHATGARLHPDLEPVASAVIAWLDATRRHPLGGFFESAAGGPPLLQNPHMHLLEAALAWLDLGGEPRATAIPWRTLAQDLARLCQSRLAEPRSGAIGEVFDAVWQPAPGTAGRVIEPGHQYEWAWLLAQCARLGVSVDLSHAVRLAEMGDRGVDSRRQVAMNAIVQDGTTADPVARLWPQTERLKAMLTLARLEPARAAEHEAAAVRAWTGLASYFATPRPGLYYDRSQPDGSFVDEPAPASSLYHIVCAIADLLAYPGG